MTVSSFEPTKVSGKLSTFLFWWTTKDNFKVTKLERWIPPSPNKNH